MNSGEFDRQLMAAYWRVFNLHQRCLRLISETPPLDLVAVMARLTMMTVAYASGVAPYYTGTLASSHRGDVETGPGTITGTIFLDPSVTNPVLGGKPAVYGPEVHVSRPWLLEWTMDWLIHDLLPDTGDEILDAVLDYLVSTYGD